MEGLEQPRRLKASDRDYPSAQVSSNVNWDVCRCGSDKGHRKQAFIILARTVRPRIKGAGSTREV
eukprot:2408423-Prorocentrum_lima.AAC.1